jgi:UDP-glucose 4-epimerase
VKAQDLENYYRIPSDNRDLNYENYFSKGLEDMTRIEEYHSHNTHRLDLEGTKQLLMKLEFIKNDLV